MNNDLLRHVLELTRNNKFLYACLQAVKEENKQLTERVAMLEGAQQDNKTFSAHLQLVQVEKQRVIELEGEVVQLKQAQHMASHTGQPIGPVEFTMTNFEKHKKEDKYWNSLPFYTHPHGYKMCLCVRPNGFGPGEGTHSGVTVHLMRGEFDDHLKWPFRGNITYVLLDQEGGKDRKDLVKVVPFDDIVSDEYCTRVVGREVYRSGLGNAKLVPLSDLQPKYLKNDCIKVVVIKVMLTQ